MFGMSMSDLDNLTTPTFKFALREDLKDKPEFLPTKAEPHAVGYDVRAAMSDHKDLILQPQQYFKIPLGFRCVPPEGWWYQLHPRSSTMYKKYMHTLIGIIDESFSFELMLVGQYMPDTPCELVVKFGDPIAQIIPVRRIDMAVEAVTNKEFDDIVRRKSFLRTGGIGSTG